jgi:hypothetical protein
LELPHWSGFTPIGIILAAEDRICPEKAKGLCPLEPH